MANSQNGWSLVSTSELNRNPFPQTTIVPIPGVRQGDVATVLHYVGSEFNKKVEKLINPGCWGYANKKIGNTNIWSNHASGTAIDLNAPKHPLGQSKTFTAAQVAQIKSILAYCEGTVRWLEGFDEMHFEINAGAAVVRRVAQKIQTGGEPMLSVDYIKDTYSQWFGVPPPQATIDYWQTRDYIEYWNGHKNSPDLIVNKQRVYIAELEKQLGEKPTEIPGTSVEKVILKQ